MFVPWKIQKIRKETVLETETGRGFSDLESGDRDLISRFLCKLYLLTFKMLVWLCNYCTSEQIPALPTLYRTIYVITPRWRQQLPQHRWFLQTLVRSLSNGLRRQVGDQVPSGFLVTDVDAVFHWRFYCLYGCIYKSINMTRRFRVAKCLVG